MPWRDDVASKRGWQILSLTAVAVVALATTAHAQRGTRQDAVDDLKAFRNAPADPPPHKKEPPPARAAPDLSVSDKGPSIAAGEPLRVEIGYNALVRSAPAPRLHTIFDKGAGVIVTNVLDGGTTACLRPIREEHGCHWTSTLINPLRGGAARNEGPPCGPFLLGSP
jgi:hypothetical protein